MKVRSRIGKKALAGVLLLAVMICLVSSVVVGLLYRCNIMESYKEQVLDYAYTAAELIDGDRICDYLSNPEPDVFYEQIEAYLSIAVRHSRLQYYYVFVPEEEEKVYLWDTDAGANGDIGDREAYTNEKEKEMALRAFSASPTREFLVGVDPVYGYLATAYAPVLNSAGEPVALVGVDLSMPGVEREQWAFLAVMAGSIALVLMLFSTGFYHFIRKTLVEPVSRLDQAAHEITRHLETGEEMQLDIHTKDEIEDLADSFSSMLHETRQYIRELSAVTAEKERIGAELNVATRIQADMLPSIFPPFPERDEFDIFASMHPAKEVGGDFYDFFLLDEDHLALVIADVSGKGVPAALFMVVTKTLLKDQAALSCSPKEILEAVNDRLCENNATGMFCTAWLCIYEISTGKCTAANAGHEFPAIGRPNGEFELLRDKHGFVLGGMEGSRYREYSFDLEPGAALFVYTDGITEATNAQNELFGLDRMLLGLNRAPGEAPAALIESVKAEIRAFVGEAPQFDDMTMLALRRRS